MPRRSISRSEPRYAGHLRLPVNTLPLRAVPVAWVGRATTGDSGDSRTSGRQTAGRRCVRSRWRGPEPERSVPARFPPARGRYRVPVPPAVGGREELQATMGPVALRLGEQPAVGRGAEAHRGHDQRPSGGGHRSARSSSVHSGVRRGEAAPGHRGRGRERGRSSHALETVRRALGLDESRTSWPLR